MDSYSLINSLTHKRVLITGATGLVGSALLSQLRKRGFSNVLALGSRDCDLRDTPKVRGVIESFHPHYIFHLAARVHGLGGNLRYKSDILVDNVLINTNVIEAARVSGVEKIVAMGSGCVYPEITAGRELSEDSIWMGPPHPSEDSYAHAKRLMLAHLSAAQRQYGLRFAFVVSGNLYGPKDNFNMEEGHVIPSLVAKFHAARQEGTVATVWGSGAAIRDFTYSDDAAEALLYILMRADGAINLGTGFRHSIAEIAHELGIIAGVPVQWDSSKPDGQLERYYDLTQLSATGFQPSVTLPEGLRRTYSWYANNFRDARK